MNDNDRWAPLVLAGLAGGTFLTGLALSALHLSPLSITVAPSDAVTASATVVGALVGGGLSIAGTIIIEKRRERQQARSNGLRLLAKLGKITSTLFNLQADLAQIRPGARLRGGVQRWQLVGPQVGNYSPVHISFEEISALIDGRSELQGDLIDLEQHHNAICEGWTTYCIARRALIDIMPLHGVTADGGFVSHLHPDQHPQAVMRIHELETLIESIVARVEVWTPKSESTCDAVGQFLKKHFNDPKFPLIRIGEG